MAKKRYRSDSELSNIGPLEYPAGVPDDLDYGDSGLPDFAQALLNTISNTESNGVYNIIYRGDRANNYDDHPKVWVEIKSGPNKGKFSSAAGKYQFIEPTWRKAQEALGLKDFSPASQDKAAWWLAQRDYSDRTGGRNLLSDLEAGGSSNMKRIGRVLSGTWTSLPSGIEQGQGHGTFADAYEGYLGKLRTGPVPKVGIPGGKAGAEAEFAPLPAPAPLSFKPKQTTLSAQSRAAVEDVLSPRLTASATARGGATKPAAAAASLSARKPSVVGLGLSVAQIGQQADNARLSGYRDVQEMGPSSKGAPAKQPFRPSGITRTENQQAQLVAMPPGARPSSVPPAPATPELDDIPKYIVSTTKVPIGKPTAQIAKETQTTDPRMRNAMTSMEGVKMPPKALPAPAPLEFKTITKKELNPEWVERQAPAIPKRRPDSRPVTEVSGTIRRGGPAILPIKTPSFNGFGIMGGGGLIRMLQQQRAPITALRAVPGIGAASRGVSPGLGYNAAYNQNGTGDGQGNNAFSDSDGKWGGAQSLTG